MNSMQQNKIRAVLFDFDGTISTLRAGWEAVMAPFMKEEILGEHLPSKSEERNLEKEISDYIDQSTGIQTVFQMEWLAEKVKEKRWNPKVKDVWDYKAEYNRRLLLQVNERIRGLEKGEYRGDQFLIEGLLPFLEVLREQKIEMYVASGTDHPDVIHEAEVLGVHNFFSDIAGAPVGKADCSKEKVIHELIETKGIQETELAVIGDGKVEIRLAKEKGALAIGLASDENVRTGINPIKKDRLEAAGADLIVGDYCELSIWKRWLGLE